MSDQELIDTLRAKIREAAVLSRQARDRGISIRIWDNGRQCINVLDSLALIAEKVTPL